MPAQVIEEVEKKFKVVGMKPTSENIQDSVVAQVSGTQYHIIGPGTATASVRIPTDFSNSAVGSIIPMTKNISQVFSAYHELGKSLEKLTANVEDTQIMMFNDKIKELLTIIKKAVTDNGSPVSKPTIDSNQLNLSSEELAQYNQKYVAISNNKIIASGASPAEAHREAKSRDPNCNPTLTRVSHSDFGL